MSHVPEAVLLPYYEAENVRNASPGSYAVQIRKSLEALCDDRGAAPGTLKRRLESLVVKGILPPVIADAASVLRQLGNRGAHSGAKVDKYDIYSIEKFFLAIADFVYVVPGSIRELRTRAEFDETHAGAAIDAKL